MESHLMGLVTAIVFLVIGIINLFWTYKVQQFYMNYYARYEDKWPIWLDPAREWRKGPGFIFFARVVGVVGVTAALFLFCSLLLVTLR